MRTLPLNSQRLLARLRTTTAAEIARHGLAGMAHRFDDVEPELVEQTGHRALGAGVVASDD